MRRDEPMIMAAGGGSRSRRNPAGALRPGAVALTFVAWLGGCSPYQVHDFERPPVDIPERYAHADEDRAVGELAEAPDRWWQAFGEPGLNDAVTRALDENYSLRQAWHRLEQAVAQARIAGAGLYPQVDLNAGATRSRFVNPSIPIGGGMTSPGRFYRSDYVVGVGLTWEVDLWKRIQSQAEAAALDALAAREDAEATALLLTGTIAQTWFSIQESRALLEILERQIESSRTFLELTELRFSQGQGSALEVLQQRSQVAATEAELPGVRANLQTLRNQLAVLLGEAPGQIGDVEPGAQLPSLPPLPALIRPADLVDVRPDLRAARDRLRAADHRVAAAVADMLPRLAVSLSYDFSGNAMSNLFDQQMGTMAANVLQPLFDAGRRGAEVDRRKAIVAEALDAYSEAMLEALREVEDALVQEKHQLELIERIDRQVELSRQTLNESRLRYMNGLTDYLDVLTALQSLQRLERSAVIERRNLLVIRSRLYRAMGGVVE